MKLTNRGGVAASIVVAAALIAVGCGGGGGGGGSDAASAAKDSAALDLVPKNAIGYVTVDANLDGESWKQFDDLAGAFDEDFAGVAEELSEESKDDDKPVDFKKDVDPWLGDTAGAAILSIETSEEFSEDENGDPSPTPAALEGEGTPEDGATPEGDGELEGGGEEDSPDAGDGGGSGDEADMLAWFDLEDREKFESFLKEHDFTKGEEVGDYQTWENADDDTHIAANDEFAFITDTRDRLETRAKYDGDSILDAKGVEDVIDGAEGDDALATLVISGPGVRNAVKDHKGLNEIGASEQLKDFDGLAVTFAAEDEGMRVHGFAKGIAKDAAKNKKQQLFTDLPGNTLLALGGHDLGGGIKKAADEAGESSAQIQQAIGAASGALGVDIDDLAKAFDGEFALAISGDDAGLGALAGGVQGAAMGGGLGSVDPAAIAEAASLTLAFEETGDASETLDSLVGAVGGLSGATGQPATATAGDFATKTMMVGGLKVTTGASDEVAALSVGVDVFTNWGDETLGENDDFTAAWDAAGAPDKTAGSFWLDFARVAQLADLKSSEDATPRGWVGWADNDGDDARFDVFMHIDEQ